MKQEILRFNFNYITNEFFVSNKNSLAFKIIKNWPDWQANCVFLYGPKNCGKSSLAKIWQKSSDAIYLDKVHFENLMNDNFDLKKITSKSWIIENLDNILTNKENHEKILNFLNILKTYNCFLLITSLYSPKLLNIKIQDLVSRLAASLVVEVKELDDELMIRIIEKYFDERGIRLDNSIISYISNRIERTYNSTIKMVKLIDEHSLSDGRKITKQFVSNLIRTCY